MQVSMESKNRIERDKPNAAVTQILQITSGHDNEKKEIDKIRGYK